MGERKKARVDTSELDLNQIRLAGKFLLLGFTTVRLSPQSTVVQVRTAAFPLKRAELTHPSRSTSAMRLIRKH